MCFKPKRDPRIEEEQKKARAEAEEAKRKAAEDLAAKKAEALAKEKEEQARTQSQVSEGQEYRQSETGASTAATQRRSRRKGTAGRRSLITASTSQGYFSRFL